MQWRRGGGRRLFVASFRPGCCRGFGQASFAGGVQTDVFLVMSGGTWLTWCIIFLGFPRLEDCELVCPLCMFLPARLRGRPLVVGGDGRCWKCGRRKKVEEGGGLNMEDGRRAMMSSTGKTSHHRCSLILSHLSDSPVWLLRLSDSPG